MDAIVRSIMITSMAKTTAAIGDLKMAAMAAAQASPSNNVICLKFKCNSLPTFDPIAAPVATVGPSKPTEPPKPTVNTLVIIDEKTL